MQLAAACSALFAGCFVGWRKVNAKKGSKEGHQSNNTETARAESSVTMEDEEKAAPKK